MVRSPTSLGGCQESELCRLTAKNHGTVVLYEFLINVTHITAKAHTHRLIIQSLTVIKTAAHLLSRHPDSRRRSVTGPKLNTALALLIG